MKNEVALQVATNKKGSRRTRKVNFSGSIDSCPCLVLNADYQPLSYLPLRQVFVSPVCTRGYGPRGEEKGRILELVKEEDMHVSVMFLVFRESHNRDPWRCLLKTMLTPSKLKCCGCCLTRVKPFFGVLIYVMFVHVIC